MHLVFYFSYSLSVESAMREKNASAHLSFSQSLSTARQTGDERTVFTSGGTYYVALNTTYLVVSAVAAGNDDLSHFPRWFIFSSQ